MSLQLDEAVRSQLRAATPSNPNARAPHEIELVGSGRQSAALRLCQGPDMQESVLKVLLGEWHQAPKRTSSGACLSNSPR